MRADLVVVLLLNRLHYKVSLEAQRNHTFHSLRIHNTWSGDCVSLRDCQIARQVLIEPWVLSEHWILLLVHQLIAETNDKHSRWDWCHAYDRQITWLHSLCRLADSMCTCVPEHWLLYDVFLQCLLCWQIEEGPLTWSQEWWSFSMAPQVTCGEWDLLLLAINVKADCKFPLQRFQLTLQMTEGKIYSC